MYSSRQPKNEDAKVVFSEFKTPAIKKEGLVLELLRRGGSSAAFQLEGGCRITTLDAQLEMINRDWWYRWLGKDHADDEEDADGDWLDMIPLEEQAAIDSYGVDHSYMEVDAPYREDLYMQVRDRAKYCDVSFYLGDDSEPLCTYSIQVGPLDPHTVGHMEYNNAGALSEFLNFYSLVYGPRWIAYADTHVRYVLDRYEKYFEGTQYESTGAFRYLQLNNRPISTPFDFSDAERMPRFFREACIFLRLGNSERLRVEDLPTLLLTELEPKKAAYLEAERVRRDAAKAAARSKTLAHPSDVDILTEDMGANPLVDE